MKTGPFGLAHDLEDLLKRHDLTAAERAALVDYALVRRTKEAANKKRREARRAMNDAMSSIGMVKVRGNLGGTYWE